MSRPRGQGQAGAVEYCLGKTGLGNNAKDKCALLSSAGMVCVCKVNQGDNRSLEGGHFLGYGAPDRCPASRCARTLTPERRPLGR